MGPSRGAPDSDVDHARDAEAMLTILRECRLRRDERVKAWGSSFNDGTTQTALDPPGGGGRFAPIEAGI